MRINKFIAERGLASRRKADELIEKGLVKVNGVVVTTPGIDVSEKDIIEVNGQKLENKENLVYFIINKPKGVICSNSDEKGRKTVVDLIKCSERVYSVGRLDYDSEGLLLLTNDGDLSYKLTHPKMQVEKTYIVKIKGDIKENELAVLRAGVVVKGVKYNKCKIKKLAFENNLTRLEVKITEGKNREIRNMFEFIGKEVTMLKRVKIADLSLGGLKRGEYRELKDYEINYLKNLAL
ncbi:MAG: rRNA pseudouridine synthase [Clostridiales bacterium]|nr:rRNA pseudouridine synthase [Clostridiales bacterium]